MAVDRAPAAEAPEQAPEGPGRGADTLPRTVTRTYPRRPCTWRKTRAGAPALSMDACPGIAGMR